MDDTGHFVLFFIVTACSFTKTSPCGIMEYKTSTAVGGGGSPVNQGKNCGYQG